MTLNGHFTLNCFCQFKFKICLFTYTSSAHYINTDFYGCWTIVTCFSGHMLTDSMFSTIKQLNKVLTAYDQLLRPIRIDCIIARFIACDSTRVSCTYWTATVHDCNLSRCIQSDPHNKKGQLSLTNPRDACEMFARFM